MVIQFFSEFAKKENSTKRPVGTVDRSLNGTLKEPCSIMNPVINLERLPQDVNPCIYTYAIIPNFRRFYFVTDWMWNNGTWEVHLTEDVLASWKTQIGATTEYVLRTDSTTDFNGDITDLTYPASTDYESHEYYPPNIFSTDLTQGCYVVGIISGTTTNSVGAITYLALSASEFEDLKDMLFSDDNLNIMGILDTSVTPPESLIAGVPAELLKTMYNPYQYIASCTWFPFTKSAITTTYPVHAFKIGWWGYPLDGDIIYAQTLELTERCGIHAHPQASRGTYLNYAPYTRRTIVGRFGTVALDSSYFKIGDEVEIVYNIDLITGQCLTTFNRRWNDGFNIKSDKIMEREFLLGVPVQLAQVGVDYLGTAVSAINTVPQIMEGAISGIASGKGAITGAIAGGASGIYNTLLSVMPQVETSGTNGSFLAPSNRTAMLEHFFQIVDEDIAHRGRPLCELRRLDTLTGFIMCAEGEIDISCFDDEREAIRQFLTTGFFWE